MRMIKTSTAGYISVIQFVMGAWFGYSMLMAIISGVLTWFVLNCFGVDIELDNSSTEQDNVDTENNKETAKTREELKNK
jgi:uncharacterized membrane protein